MKWLLLVSFSSVLLFTFSSARAQKHAGPRYFKEIERPGSVYAVLNNAHVGGRLFKLQELNEEGKPIGPVLKVFVQHFNGRGELSQEYRKADLVIACHRKLLPLDAQARHVLPHSKGDIYIYMMLNHVLIVSDRKIPNYDVLVGDLQPRRQICNRD